MIITTIETKKTERKIIEVKPVNLMKRFQPCIRHKPKTHEENLLKGSITRYVKSNQKDFTFCVYSQIACEFIHKTDKERDYSFFEWTKKIRRIKHNTTAKVSTKLQFAAFLGTLIVLIVEKGYSENQAWNVVCNNPNKLGEFFDWWYFNGYPILLSSDDEFDEFWITRKDCIVSSLVGVNPSMDIEAIPFIIFQ